MTLLKDSNITLHKILRKNRPDQTQTVAFSKWKDKGIDTVRFSLKRRLLDIADKTAKDKLVNTIIRIPEANRLAKEDDHDPDAFTAWAASKSHLLVR